MSQCSGWSRSVRGSSGFGLTLVFLTLLACKQSDTEADPTTPGQPVVAQPNVAQPGVPQAATARIRKAWLEGTFAVAEGTDPYSWVTLRLESSTPGGEDVIHPVGSYAQNCKNEAQEGAVSVLNCYHLGAGDKLTLTQSGNQLKVTHMPYSEQENGAPKLVTTVTLAPGETIVAGPED